MSGHTNLDLSQAIKALQTATTPVKIRRPICVMWSPTQYLAMQGEDVFLFDDDPTALVASVKFEPTVYDRAAADFYIDTDVEVPESEAPEAPPESEVPSEAPEGATQVAQTAPAAHHQPWKKGRRG